MCYHGNRRSGRIGKGLDWTESVCVIVVREGQVEEGRVWTRLRVCYHCNRGPGRIGKGLDWTESVCVILVIDGQVE